MAIIKGKALFASTSKADVKFGAPGNYYITVEVDEATYADAEALGLKCKRNMYKGQEQLTVNLRLKGGGKRKDGSDYLNDPIPVVIKTAENAKAPYTEKARDAVGELVSRPKEVPQGSVVRVSYKSREWSMMGKEGITFDLRAVQILKEGASGDAMGEFDTEDESGDEDF